MGPAGGGAGADREAEPKLRWTLARAAAVVAAVVLAAGTAAAIGVTGWKVLSEKLAEQHDEPAAAPAPAATRHRRARPAPSEPIGDAPLGVGAPGPLDDPSAHAPERARPRPRRATPVPQAPAPASAAELFARANGARRSGRYDEAVRTYRELARAHAGSREEVLSRVTLGDLLLTRLGDARGALASFDHYLASSPSGTLAEEALVGRALALGRLGRSSEERRAWEELLRRHPNSVHVARARRRLDALR